MQSTHSLLVRVSHKGNHYSDPCQATDPRGNNESTAQYVYIFLCNSSVVLFVENSLLKTLF